MLCRIKWRPTQTHQPPAAFRGMFVVCFVCHDSVTALRSSPAGSDTFSLWQKHWWRCISNMEGNFSPEDSEAGCQEEGHQFTNLDWMGKIWVTCPLASHLTPECPRDAYYCATAENCGSAGKPQLHLCRTAKKKSKDILVSTFCWWVNVKMTILPSQIL